MSGDVDVVAHLILDPIALVVLMAGQLVEALALVDQLAQLEHEEPGPLAVSKQHGKALVLGENRLQLAHLGSVVDDQPVANRNRQLEQPPEVLGAAREHRQASGP